MTQQQCVPWGFNSAKRSSLWLITLPNYPPAPQIALRFSPKGAAVLVFVAGAGSGHRSARLCVQSLSDTSLQKAELSKVRAAPKLPGSRGVRGAGSAPQSSRSCWHRAAARCGPLPGSGGSQGAGIPFVLGGRWQGKGRAGSGHLGWAASGACSSPRGAGGCTHKRMLAQMDWVCEADTSTCLRVAFSLANVNAVCQPMDNSPSFPSAPCPLLPNPKSDKS